MNVEELIAEIKAEYYKLDEAGLIDEASIYRWVEIAVKRFGGAVAVDSEAVIRSKKGQAELPNAFYDLIYAYKCEPWYYECDEKVKPELQHEIGFIERTERKERWCSCDECCKEECQNTIVEKLYINTHEVKFHYRYPVLLRLGKRMKRSDCIDKCRNKYVKDCPWEVMINGPIMYCNFDGPIYIKYREIPMEENGDPYIPETPLGLVSKYVETYVKMRLFEVVAANGEMQGAGDMYKVFAQREQYEFNQALRDAIMMDTQLSKVGEKMRRENRRKMQVYENMWPNAVPQHIKFI